MNATGSNTCLRADSIKLDGIEPVHVTFTISIFYKLAKVAAREFFTVNFQQFDS